MCQPPPRRPPCRDGERGLALFLPLLLLALAVGTEAHGRRRKKKDPAATEPGEQVGQDEQEGRRKKRGKGKRRRPEPGPREAPPAQEPCREGQSRCEGRVSFVVKDADGAGTPPLRYRVRIGEVRVDGACPSPDGPGPGRCTPTGFSLALAPDELDVVVEATGYRPLLQTLGPIYEPIPGCGGPCRQSEVHLSLRREKVD